MLEAGIITPNESAWASPVVITTKKDGSPRFCIDYRKLNNIMVPNRWPLPLVDEIIEDLKGSTVFSTFDLFQGYWQIKMNEACKEMTTFICKFGTYQFEVMPFGLMNSQATFQRMMDRILLKVENVRCYVDDIVVFSATIQEHLIHLETVMELLKKHGLGVRLKKCYFMQPRIELLGHFVDAAGVHTDYRKIVRVRDAEIPSTRKELRSFIGLCSYYRHFIKDFAKISKPLADKTSDKVAFTWTDDMSTAFTQLKTALCSPPVLAYPDYEKEFIVSTDASSKAIGAVLSQADEDGREHPIYN